MEKKIIFLFTDNILKTLVIINYKRRKHRQRTRQQTLKSWWLWVWRWHCSCCNCCCCWWRSSSFWRRSSMTLRCEFECWVSTNVGLAAGRYSGTSRPDLNRTPHALQSVFGPNGPVRHCGVLSVAQWLQRRTPSPVTDPSLLALDFPANTGEDDDDLGYSLLLSFLLLLERNGVVWDPMDAGGGMLWNDVASSFTNWESHSSSTASSLYGYSEIKKR